MITLVPFPSSLVTAISTFCASVSALAISTKFYLLAICATVVINLMILVMTRFDWFAREMSNQTLLKFTTSSELISVDSVHSDMLTELIYTIGLKKSNLIQEFISELRRLNGNNKVTLIAGYNNTDL